MDFIQQEIIDPLGKALYGYVLISLLLGAGIYFTVRTRFIQIRYFPQMLRQLGRSAHTDGEISSFQAFCVGLASRVGTGNIAGVAVALTLGGAGAVFWMWVTAVLGMATALIEATLAQIFKIRVADGGFRGGPAFYIQRGLGSRAGGIVFAVLLIFTSAVAFNMVQANAVSDVLQSTHAVGPQWTTLGLIVLTAPVLFGGVRRVARVAGVVLPVMAIAYVGLALAIVLANIDRLPGVIGQIIGGAFGVQQVAGGLGGTLAAAMLNGVKRGLFANEAGMGSAPNVAATATVAHPVEQGLIQALGVFVDTMLVCTATAFIILMSSPDVYDPAHAGAVAGASLTQAAVAAGLGSWTTSVMTTVVFVFAFSSVLSNYVCAEANLIFLGGGSRAVKLLKIWTLIAVTFGAMAKLGLVWKLADIGMALMAIVNLVAICLLGRWAFAAIRDFHRQAAWGLEPIFVAAEARLPGRLKGDIWVHRNRGPSRDALAGVRRVERRPVAPMNGVR